MQLCIRRGARIVGAGVLGLTVLTLCFDAPAHAATPVPPTTTWPGTMTDAAWPGKIVDSVDLGSIGSAAPAQSSTVPSTTAARPRSTVGPTVPRPVAVAVATITLDSSPSTGDPSGSGTDATSAASADVWAKLRKCESGGRYDLNTGNGFYGAYQFAAKTWTKLGYDGLPHQAAPDVQDEAARKLQAKAGWGQWPACSRRLGLR